MSKRRRKPESGETGPSVDRGGTRGGAGLFDRHGTLAVWVLMGAYTLVFSAVSLVKYGYFLYNDFDLAIFSQAAWTTMRGSMHSSILGLNYLGSHMSLTMVLLSPVYTVLPSPVTLLVIQSVVLSLGALPVYWLARRELKNGFVAVSFAALYLLYPALGYTNLYEFHPVTLATTTLLFTFYYLWVGRFGLMLLFAVLSLMAKEDVPVVVFMMGLYALLLRRPRRWMYAVTLAGLSVAFLVVSLGVVMPALNQGQVEYASFYQDWGDTMGEAFVNMATSPLKVLKAFFWTTYDGPSPARRDYCVTVKHQYWVHLLVPLLLLSLLSPGTLFIALPAAAQHLLSFRTSEHTIVFHYTALVTPFVVMAAVLGLRNLLRLLTRGLPEGLTDEVMRTRTVPRMLAVILTVMTLVVAVVCNVFFGPVVGCGIYQAQGASERTWPDAKDRQMAPFMRALSARLPDGVPVATGFRFMARAAHRHDLASVHHVLKGKYTYSTKDYPVPDDLEAVLVDVSDWRYLSFMRDDGGQRLREMVRRSRLEVADAAGDVVLLLRAEKPAPNPFDRLFESSPPKVPRNGGHVFDERLTLLGWDDMPLGVNRGETFPIHTCWRRIGPDALFHVPLRDPPPDGPKTLALFYLTRFSLWSRDGQPISSDLRHICYTFYPVHDWQRGETVRMTYHFPVPVGCPAGSYRVMLEVMDGVKGSPLRPVVPFHVDAAQRRAAIPLGTVTVTGAAD